MCDGIKQNTFNPKTVMSMGSILIIDDNKSVLTSLEFLLDETFSHVETVSDPNRILSLIESVEYELVINAGDYLLAHSATAYIDYRDLTFFTAEELRLARNEIYARYGRMFKDEGLQAYFNSKWWYTPRIQPEDFNEDWLNAYEKENIALIQEYEKVMN